MRLFAIIQFLALLITGVAAVTTVSASSSVISSSSSSSISVAPTTVWVTITTNGNVATVQTIYSQTFMSTYTDVAYSVAAGSVGMGTLSGTVGGVRTYTQSSANDAGTAIYASSLGLLALLFNWLV